MTRCSAYGGMFRVPRLQSRRGVSAHLSVSARCPSARFTSLATGPGELPAAEEEALAPRPCATRITSSTSNLFNILTQKGQRTFIMYLMIDAPLGVRRHGSGAHGRDLQEKSKYHSIYRLRSLRLHLQAPLVGPPQHYFQNVDGAKEVAVYRAGSPGAARSINIMTRSSGGMTIGLKGAENNRHHGTNRRCAYWLMGRQTSGAPARNWPLAGGRLWTKYYLSHWETLSTRGAADLPRRLGAAGRARP